MVYSKNRSLRGYQKNAAYFARKVRKHGQTKFVRFLLDDTIDNVLKLENKLYEHKVELEMGIGAIYSLVPTVGSSEELNKKLYNALAFALYPYFTGFSSRWEQTLAATRNKDYSTRALAFTLRKGIHTFVFDDYQNNNQGILEYQCGKLQNQLQLETSVGVSGAVVLEKEYIRKLFD